MQEDLFELVESARAGDRESFDELVRRTHSDTYTLALRLTGHEEDARDVVQEAYLRAYRGLRRFRGDAQFTTWLYRITANCAATQLGKRQRHSHDELDDHDEIVDLSEATSPEARADQTELRERLTAALGGLPPRLRAVVVLRDIYDLPHEAIATELGITESAAKVRLHRARRKLRDRLHLDRLGSDAVEPAVTDDVVGAEPPAVAAAPVVPRAVHPERGELDRGRARAL